jgi:hypothetical protein
MIGWLEGWRVGKMINWKTGRLEDRAILQSSNLIVFEELAVA